MSARERERRRGREKGANEIVALRSKNEEEEMASLDDLGGIPRPNKGTSGSCEREREGERSTTLRFISFDLSLLTPPSNGLNSTLKSN